MSSHVHPILRKRKEREQPQPPLAAAKSEPAAVAPSPAGNRLLAGYLAHEFLTKGTLFGKKWPTERPESAVGSAPSAQSGSIVLGSPRSIHTPMAYDEVACLLKTDGVHIPGIVNPTQLARWLQM